ncbi:hypothetical protein [Pseudooceanicola sp.]|uniref:hypothetical protein n=1 Tax=Pseudooceanicola sp. TaxID=1914328 RepID=UPI0035C6D9CC
MKLLLTAPLALSLTLASSPANALSCLRPEVLRSYQEAAEAKETYVVVSGVISHDVAAVPEARNADSPRIAFTARLAGASLTHDGFTAPFDAPVEVTLNCVSAWCAPLPPQHASVLAFVQKTEDGYSLDMQPCQQWLFENPEPEQMVALVDCHTSGNCSAD